VCRLSLSLWKNLYRSSCTAQGAREKLFEGPLLGCKAPGWGETRQEGALLRGGALLGCKRETSKGRGRRLTEGRPRLEGAS